MPWINLVKQTVIETAMNADTSASAKSCRVIACAQASGSQTLTGVRKRGKNLTFPL